MYLLIQILNNVRVWRDKQVYKGGLKSDTNFLLKRLYCQPKKKKPNFISALNVEIHV